MGREFIELFDKWAQTYDHTVVGQDLEYKEVFINYEQILEETAEATAGFVVEFGVGTGNLTKKLLEKKRTVYGVEPSEQMRTIASMKLNDVTIVDGDFLEFPIPEAPIDSLTSTYAFHHLTDDEKERAIKLYRTLLTSGGKVVFADTVFQDQRAKETAIRKAERNGFLSLAQDLKTEYYTTVPFFQEAFANNGFTVSFKQMNDFVYLMEAVKLE